jgi:UDP-2,3-diacylglucosamine hydrolase
MEKLSIRLEKGKKIYFASDFHLGLLTRSKKEDRKREQRILRWLHAIKDDCQALFLLGDIFDFWFEYRHAVPKGHTRLIGKMAELSDQGIAVFIFPGNHDMWMFGYLEEETGVRIFHDPIMAAINDRSFLLGHGDGLGPGDNFYKLLKKIFRNGFTRFLFRWLHPDIGIKLARSWSRQSRINKEGLGEEFKGDEEYLVQYCNNMEDQEHHDFYIFGHRHLPLEIDINNKSKYINLGEWVQSCTYGQFDGQRFELKKFDG